MEWYASVHVASYLGGSLSAIRFQLITSDDCGLFVDQVEKQEFGLKPMNCPGHCLMFDHCVRSYRGEGWWIVLLVVLGCIKYV